MLTDLIGNIRKISDFLGVCLDDSILQQIAKASSFNEMKKNPTTNMSWNNKFRVEGSQPFLRKGSVGDWKNHFNTEQCQQFDAIYDRKMKDAGLLFTF